MNHLKITSGAYGITMPKMTVTVEAVEGGEIRTGVDGKKYFFKDDGTIHLN